jgi:hypothetical protein
LHEKKEEMEATKRKLNIEVMKKRGMKRMQKKLKEGKGEPSREARKRKIKQKIDIQRK